MPLPASPIVAFRARSAVAPDLAAGPRVERHGFVRRGDVHHAVDDDRRDLQRALAAGRDRKRPLGHEAGDVAGVDLARAGCDGCRSGARDRSATRRSVRWQGTAVTARTSDKHASRRIVESLSIIRAALSMRMLLIVVALVGAVLAQERTLLDGRPVVVIANDKLTPQCAHRRWSHGPVGAERRSGCREPEVSYLSRGTGRGGCSRGSRYRNRRPAGSHSQRGAGSPMIVS